MMSANGNVHTPGTGTSDSSHSSDDLITRTPIWANQSRRHSIALQVHLVSFQLARVVAVGERRLEQFGAEKIRSLRRCMHLLFAATTVSPVSVQVSLYRWHGYQCQQMTPEAIRCRKHTH